MFGGGRSSFFVAGTVLSLVAFVAALAYLYLFARESVSDDDALVAAAEQRWKPDQFPAMAISETFRRLVTERMLPAWFEEYGAAPALRRRSSVVLELGPVVGHRAAAAVCAGRLSPGEVARVARFWHELVC